MIPTTKNWLNGLKVTAAGNENSGNHNPKPNDMSLDTLLMLLNEGYDRVTWIGSDRDKASNEICQKYDTNQTTWSLEAFINVNASYIGGMTKNAIMGKEDYSDEDWQNLVLSPGRALKYAQEHNFEDLPQEIIDSIAEDGLTSYRFVTRFLKVNQTDPVPETIVESTLSDEDQIDYLYDIYGEQPNFPSTYRDMYEGTNRDRKREVHYHNNQKGTHFERSNANIPFDAPIFSHSHVGCQCYLKVWKSTDPNDCVFVDANGW